MWLITPRWPAAVNYFNDNGVQAEGLACNSAAVTGAKNAAYAAAEISVEDAFPNAGEEEKHITGDHDISDGHGVYVECSASEQQLLVTVKLTVKTQSFLSQLVYAGDLKNTVEAVARAKPGASGGLFGGAGIVALGKNGYGIGINSSTVTVNGGGMFVNSSGNSANPYGAWQTDAFDLNGNTYITTTKCIGVVGGVDGIFSTSQTHLTGPGLCVPKPSQIDPPDFDALIPAPPAAPTCSTNGTWNATTRVATPGNYPSGLTTPAEGATFQSGVYCFGGALTINGGSTVTGGNLTWVFGNGQNIYFNGNTTSTFTSLIVYLNNGNWQENGSATITVSPGAFRFYGLGTSKYVTSGSGVETFVDGFMYFEKGKLESYGTTNMNIKAPTTGPYANVVIYMPITNTSEWAIHGGSNFYITGSIVAPGSYLHLNGSSNLTGYNSQVIVDHIWLESANITINYDASQNISSPQPPTLELYK
jgi:hypothetical protein